ncbi:MAG: hypothetical protein QM785_13940 [Pyrinomonadaceae bacterium]
MDAVPGYVSVIFLLTAFTAVWFLLQAVKAVGLQTLPAKILLFFLPFWIILQCVLSIGGFYQQTDAFPPRLFVFGILPAILLILIFLVFSRSSFIERLPLKYLTLLHVIRIPVELVLYWLFVGSVVPRIMTFAGWNFDILSGILAVAVYFAAFREGEPNRALLLGFNAVGLVLLITIVTLAILSLPSPIQELAFDQPNRGVLFFPYSLLPSIVVPIVLFAHLASLWKLAVGKTN